MEWRLEIHHIDVGQGDSTLIIARKIEPEGKDYKTVGIRTALIDGGNLGKGNTVDNYIKNLKIKEINVMVATHYDEDHFNGLRYLLKNYNNEENDNCFKNTLIFDQGEQGTVSTKTKRGPVGHPGYIPVSSISGRDNPYQLYLDSIGTQNTRERITAKVKKTGRQGADEIAGWKDPNFLIGREILWNSGSALDNAPKMYCIAANQYIQRHPEEKDKRRSILTPSGTAVDPKNEKSLAFLIKFNNFRYYLGGDIETTQEEQIAKYLNPNDDEAGRVHAMKVSHHGSDRSTSASFVNRLRPSAAFISCGYGNSFQHPRQIVLDNLEGCISLQRYYLTNDRGNDSFYKRNGEYIKDKEITMRPDTSGAYTSKAVVAGSWGTIKENKKVKKHDGSSSAIKGNIILTVSNEQSLLPPDGDLEKGKSRFNVTGYSANIAKHGRFNNSHF